MTITLEDFRSNVAAIARTNRFTVEFIGPSFDDFTIPVNYKFLVNKATIPRKDISGPIIKYRGNTMMISGDFKKEVLNISFWNDDKFGTRKFFDRWMSTIFDTTGRVATGDGTSLAIRQPLSQTRMGNNLILTPLGYGVKTTPEGIEGEKLRRYEFENIVPVELGSIELDMSNPDTVQEFQVVFQYSHWNDF